MYRNSAELCKPELFIGIQSIEKKVPYKGY